MDSNLQVNQNNNPFQLEAQNKWTVSPLIIGGIIIVALIFGGLVVYFWQRYPEKRPFDIPSRGKACTMEAKICPDGSVVGRVPPDCEFAPCPSSGSSIPPIVTSVPEGESVPSGI